MLSRARNVGSIFLLYYAGMGVDHGGRGTGDKPPPRIWSGGIKRGDCPPPQILSCCKIVSTRLLALQCRKCFCLYSRTFIVSPAMRPPRIPVRSTPMCAGDISMHDNYMWKVLIVDSYLQSDRNTNVFCTVSTLTATAVPLLCSDGHQLLKK